MSVVLPPRTSYLLLILVAGCESEAEKQLAVSTIYEHLHNSTYTKYEQEAGKSSITWKAAKGDTRTVFVAQSRLDAKWVEYLTDCHMRINILNAVQPLVSNAVRITWSIQQASPIESAGSLAP